MYKIEGCYMPNQEIIKYPFFPTGGHAKDLTIPPTDSREFAYLAQRLQYQSPEELDAVIQDRMRFAREVWNTDILPDG